MNRDELLRVMRVYRYAVQSSVTPGGAPQAAIIGVAVTDGFDIVFDALSGSRKVQNLRVNRRIALVFGNTTGGDERSVQYEGIANEPVGAELEELQRHYFWVFPDGRDRRHLPGMTYFRVTPVWIRYSDFRTDPPTIVEFGAGDLA
jgi:hypothetical protein